MKQVLTLTISLLLTQFLLAQDHIYIDGQRKISGKVILYEPGKVLVYKNKSGEQIRIEGDETLKIQQVTIRSLDLQQQKVITQLQMGLGFGVDNGIYFHPDFRLNISGEVTNKIFLGFGTGFDFYPDYNISPIYLNMVTYLNEDIKSLYLNGKIGYGLGVQQRNPIQEYESLSGGFFSEFEVGSRIQRKKSFITWGVGLKFQDSSNSREINDWWWGGTRIITENQSFRRLTLRIGFGL